MEKLEWLQAFAEPEQPETGAAAPTPEQQERLAALSPEAVLRRGFAVVRKESGAVVSKAQGVRPSERVEIRFADGAAAAEILTVSGGK